MAQRAVRPCAYPVVAQRFASPSRTIVVLTNDKMLHPTAFIQTMTDPQIFNRTFNSGADGTRHYNACVGNNGFVDSKSYGDGFAEAVDILTSALESDDHRGQLDTLIYPICFCARHHVELFLKAQIIAIGSMRGIAPAEPVSGIHHLGKLWDALVKVATDTDRRFVEPLEGMRETISNIAEIDPTGQTFRYPTSNESVKHLVRTPVINVPTLRREFRALARRIGDFEDLADAVADEYRRGTFTKRLSRRELESIARALPRRESWATGPDFDEAKAMLLAKFSLSKNDFNRAVCLIQEHREFCSHLGLSKPIPNLDTASLDRLNRLFNGEISIEEIPAEELVALGAVFEIASPSHYSEDYDRMASYMADDFDANDCGQTQVPRWARGIKRLSLGLRKVGQPDLSDHLDQKVDPSAYIEKMDKANEGFSRLRARIRSGSDDEPPLGE
jgi:hypothetical protein